MATVFNPFGLKAKHSPSGIIRPQRWVVPASDITANAGSWDSLFQDDAVYIDTTGRLRLTASAVGSGAGACIGSFQGVEFNDSNGRRTVSNQFNKNVIFNPVANVGLGTTDVWFWIYTDPELVYELQLAGTPTTVNGPTSGAFTAGSPPFNLIGNLIGYSQNTAAANTVTGFSPGYGFAAGAAPGTTGAPFVVYNLAYDNMPNNAYVAGTPTGIPGSTWSDAYPTVLVRLANAQFNGVLPAF